MDDTSREFEGKTLDEAIREACAYFDLPREKLEIDIIRDAKSGIFGLVGSRKAVIRAQRAPVAARVGDILGSPLREGRQTSPQAHQNHQPRREHAPASAEEPASRTATQERTSAPAAERPAPATSSAAHATIHAGRTDREVPSAAHSAAPSPISSHASSEDEPLRERRRKPARSGRETGRENGRETGREAQPFTPRPRSAGFQNRPPRREQDNDFDFTDEQDPDRTPAPLESLDQDMLRTLVQETASRLIGPIVHDAALDVEIGGGRIAVHIGSDEDLGLLIGREGQTLACLQYLTTRIVARKLNAPVRIQLDAGDYRERQDEKLRELALMLAERAKATGRVCPTRPLSSYQRRIVHMALQDDPTIQTRSAGEGPLKRVVIQRARTD